jgi:hypothetical protein
MNSSHPTISPGLLGILGVFLAVFAHSASARAAEIDRNLARYFENYCYDCHSAASADANTEFDLYSTVKGEFGLRGHPAIIEDLLWVIEEGEMPPRTAEKQPSQEENAEAEHLLSAILEDLREASKDDPGRVVMARLNRGEYSNALRDLSGGKSIKVDDILPADSGAGEGFSNVGEALNMSAGQIERYLRASTRALQHALILPEDGIQWFDEPLTFKDSPAELREHLITRMKEWHEAAAHRWYDLWFEDLEKTHGMTFGLYWEAAWKLHHQQGGQTAEEIAALYENALNPRLISLWHELLTTEVDHAFQEEIGYLVARQIRWWQSLPSPGEITEEQLREVLEKEDEWFANSRSWKWSPKYETTPTGRDARRAKINQEPGQREYAITIPQAGETSPTTIQLLVTDAGDGNDADVIRWKNGEFRFADGEEIRWENWEIGVETVQAPSLTEVPVPDGAKEFRIKAIADPERGRNSSVQTAVLLDEELSELDYHLLVRDEAREVWGAESSAAMEAYEHARQEQRAFVRRTLRVPDHEHPWYYYDVNALGNFTNRTGLDIRFVGGPWRVSPVIPVSKTRIHWVNAPALQTEMPEDDLQDIQALQADLDQALQVPHQKLLFFLRDHGITNFPEGIIPPDDALNGLDKAALREFQKLTEAVRRTERHYREQARPIIHDFAERAWRRHLSPREIEPLMAAYETKRGNGGSFDAAVKMALKTVLMSPHFLFKSRRTLNSTEPYRLTAHEVADRLSFTIWGSIPDRDLIDLAESGELLQQDVLLAQTRRMLRDDRARGLATEFAGVWFKFRDFEANPDQEKFPSFDQKLYDAMEEEAIRFFADLFQNDGSIQDILTADYKLINGLLAEHYGIEGVNGEEWQRVPAPEHLKGGILTMAGVLTKTSAPLRTSPVLRGTWLLEDVLGEEMPPPPPNVPELSEDETNEAGLTIAQQLAAHRERPECASCHNKIDPLGLALENFDPIGQWRETVAEGQPVTNEATTADGVNLNGVESLREYLVSQKLDSLMRQFNRKLLGYALGRGVEVGDAALLERMRQAMTENDFRFLPALEQVVTSKQFLYRRDPGTEA